MIYQEYYVKGTEPSKKCNCHTKVKICLDSHLPASDACPNVGTSVYFIRPKDSTGTTDDSAYTLPAEYKDAVCNIHVNADSSASAQTDATAPNDASATQPATDPNAASDAQQSAQPATPTP